MKKKEKSNSFKGEKECGMKLFNKGIFLCLFILKAFGLISCGSRENTSLEERKNPIEISPSLLKEEEEYKGEAKKFSEEYPELPLENRFRFIDIEEGIKIMERGTGILYFGFPDCKWCQAYVPLLNEVVMENSDFPIWAVNIKEDREENTENYQRILEIAKDKIKLDKEGKPRLFVPIVFLVHNGVILEVEDESSRVPGDIDTRAYWTEEKKNEFKLRLSRAIIELNKGCESCNEGSLYFIRRGMKWELSFLNKKQTENICILSVEGKNCRGGVYNSSILSKNLLIISCGLVIAPPTTTA